MASTVHGVLTENTVATVQVDPGVNGIVVVNRSLQGAIWVRIDNVDPQIAMPGSYVVMGARDFAVGRSAVRAGNLPVKMISDVALAYTVEAIA